MEALILALAIAIATKTGESVGSSLGSAASEAIKNLTATVRRKLRGDQKREAVLERATEAEPSRESIGELAQVMLRAAQDDPDFAAELRSYAAQLHIPHETNNRFETKVTGGTVKNIVNVGNADTLRFD